MQDDDRGVPVRSQKMFLTSIPAAFMGYDLIEWLMDRLSIEDSLEAVHLANLLCQFGYYFPINELKNLLVKDDSSLYRFQTPYYWPSQHHTPDNIEYAIYLDKRSQRNRQKHGLEDYELDAYNNLKKILANKWEFVMMQADEQLKIAKDRKKGEKIVTDSQEKAYWRVYRPPPGYTTVVESSPVPTREQRSKARSRTREHLTDEYEFMKNYMAMSRNRVSQVAESLIDYTDTFAEYDPVLNPAIPSNPWVADDPSYWMLNQPLVEVPTEKRVRKWAISLEDLITDPLGLQELLAYMKKEFSHENLRFWLAVQELRRGPGTEAFIKKQVKEIWDEFLSPGAKAEINIDSQTMELTKQNMKNPSRYTFEEAAGHIYLLLLKKDCYPRFIRSDSYKTLLANALKPRNMKKTFFNFPARKKPASTPAPAGPGGGAPGPSNPKERMWEDFNIYGAQGGDANESPETNEGTSTNKANVDESVCPWESFIPDTGGPGGSNVASGPSQQRKSPRGSVGSGSHKRRGSDPLVSTRTTSGPGSSGLTPGSSNNPIEGGTSPHHGAGKHRSHHQSGLSDTKGSCGATVKSCSATRTSSLENSLERSNSCRRKQNEIRGSVHDEAAASQHHHHHHHHHHHPSHGSNSRRAKNRSKRKKPSIRSSTLTSAGELAAAIAAAATATTTASSTQFDVPDHKPIGHHPPHHQHSTSSLLSSVVTPASVLAVGHSFDRGIVISVPDGPTVTHVASVENPGAGANVPVIQTATTTSSKCTQTKLEDDDDLFNIPTSPTLARQSPVRGVHQLVKRELLIDGNQAENVPANSTLEILSGTNTDKKIQDNLPEKGAETSAEKGPENANSHSGRNSAAGSTAMEESKPPERKSEIGTWASSTEVCPWEDEENRRDNHTPFVKTYATLGFL